MKKLFTIILSLFTSLLFSQTIIYNNRPGPNAEQTKITEENAEYYNTEVNAAMSQKNYEKAHYYLDQWNRYGMRDARFYSLLADWCLTQNNKRAAKRYLMRAYRKYSCFECKTRADKIF